MSSSRAILEVERLENRLVPAPVARVVASFETVFQKTLVGDFNGDGKADAASYSRGRWFVQTSNGERLERPVLWARWPGHTRSIRFFAADFNGDGKQDVASLLSNGKWYVGISTGTSFVGSYWETPPRTKFAAYFTGDFNGDQMADIAGLTKTGEVRVALSTGASFETTTWATGLVGRWTRFTAGDFNGDGKTDLAGLQYGTWTVALSTGNSLDMQTWASWDPVIGPNRIWVGDFTGDGKDDVAWIKQQGDLLIGASNGSAFDTSSWGTVLGNAKRYLASDYDGDGDDDLATIRGGSIVISYLDAGTIERQQRVGWSPAPAFPCGWAQDFDGDGIDDIVFKRPNGEWFYLYPSLEAVPVAYLAYAPYRGEVPPYLSGAPWNPNNSRDFIDKTSLWMQRQMDFNKRQAFYVYVYNFRDELRRWVGQAGVLGLSATDDLRDFLRPKVEAKFIDTRSLLESRYPGLTETKYRLLLAMNLAHGYFIFGPGPHLRTLWDLVHTKVGNCAHLAHLVKELAGLQGIAAKHYAVLVKYETPYGGYGTGHNIVIADGMILDAEINVAFNIGSLSAFYRITPSNRLLRLLTKHKVYGFYDWLNYPPIRNEQLSRGQDGGVIAFLYSFTFGGFGQGATRIWQIHWQPK